jgi:hypothetical protein
MFFTRTWIWRKCQTAKSFTGVSNPHPECSDEDEMEFIPTNELLDYRASQLHYLPPQKYLLVQSDEPRKLTEKNSSASHKKSYPPLPVKETHLVLKNYKAMRALLTENLLKAPLPTSVFPSYRTIRNISDLEHRKCDNCGRKNKCEILCDGPKCNRGYCLKCLGLKTIPKRLLHWNTEAVKSKAASTLPSGPRYCPFFAKFCHPICEVDLPPTSGIQFVEKTVQKRPRKTKQKSVNSAPPTAAITEAHSNKKQRKSKTLHSPPAPITASDHITKVATSVAQHWLRDNTPLTCLPSVDHHPIIDPNRPPLSPGFTEIHLIPNILVKCPLVKAAAHSSNHSSPKFRIIINTTTNEIVINCLNGKCSSPCIKINSNSALQEKTKKRSRSKSPDNPQPNQRPRRLCRTSLTPSPVPSPTPPLSSQVSPNLSPHHPSPNLSPYSNPLTPLPLPTDTPPP